MDTRLAVAGGRPSFGAGTTVGTAPYGLALTPALAASHTVAFTNRQDGLDPLPHPECSSVVGCEPYRFSV